jgi:hypothetical protein
VLCVTHFISGLEAYRFRSLFFGECQMTGHADNQTEPAPANNPSPDKASDPAQDNALVTAQVTDSDEEARRLFLAALSVSGDITAAAKAAGHSNDAAFFARRQSSVAFAAEWDAAMDIAYLRLESVLVAGALQAAADPASNADLRVMAAWHRLSLSLLAARRTLRGAFKRAPQYGAADARGSLLAKLDLMRQRAQGDKYQSGT